MLPRLSLASAAFNAVVAIAAATLMAAIDVLPLTTALITAAAMYAVWFAVAAAGAVAARPHRDQLTAYEQARDELEALADAQWERGITHETDTYLQLNHRVERLGAGLPVWLR